MSMKNRSWLSVVVAQCELLAIIKLARLMMMIPAEIRKISVKLSQFSVPFSIVLYGRRWEYKHNGKSMMMPTNVSCKTG